jgi:hypothetical protein
MNATYQKYVLVKVAVVHKMYSRKMEVHVVPAHLA